MTASEYLRRQSICPGGRGHEKLNFNVFIGFISIKSLLKSMLSSFFRLKPPFFGVYSPFLRR